MVFTNYYKLLPTFGKMGKVKECQYKFNNGNMRSANSALVMKKEW